MACVFCERVELGEVISRNRLAAAFFDAFPISPGHALIVPIRHESDFLNLRPEEHAAISELIPAVRERVTVEHSPDGYNIGVNIGEAGGQTVLHAHLHLIPRYRGDVDDPRGGIRWMFPKRAKYWK